MPRRNEVYYQLSSLALPKKTWLRWERRWRRGSKMVRLYPLQEAVIISFPSQHHNLDTNCAVRMTCLWTSMTSKFQLELILATLHHCLTSLACRICCGGSVLPIISWTVTLAWATTCCPPSENFLFWKKNYICNQDNAHDIDIFPDEKITKRSEPTNLAQTKINIVKGLQTYLNDLTTYQGFRIRLVIIKILGKYWYILNKWRIV